MDHYEIWVDLQPGVRDLEFTEAVTNWMRFLKDRGLIEGHTLRRRKLGFGPEGLGEFHVSIHFKGLAQVDEAFSMAATRGSEVERVHAEVYSRIRNLKTALYRDFPDSVREI